jgi:aryl-alcohol dehydrogenase-like predicted oxidoreductase
VFDFATTLNRDAALRSISMGAPQILGGNHRRIGYVSPEHMFRAFADRQTGAAAQMVGFTNFCLSSETLMRAIRERDFLTVATQYNGAGQAAHYAGLMQSQYDRMAK